MVADTGLVLNQALDRDETVLFEGGQATLLDVDHGTYPFVTSSNATAAGACTGSGVPPTRIDRVIGILKAYTTRVGEGPFPTELHDDAGEFLRKTGGEYGTTTGRPRRCGWFDAVIGRYAQRVNGLTDTVVTKLDVLSGLEKVPVCVAYDVEGKRYDEMPVSQSDFHHAKPIYEELPGLVGGHLGGAHLRRPAGERAALRAGPRGDDRRTDLRHRRRPRPRGHHRAARPARLTAYTAAWREHRIGRPGWSRYDATLPLAVLDFVGIEYGETASDSIAGAVQLARAVEAAGYRRYWVSEHHNMTSLACSAPEILIAHLLTLTETIRVGAAGIMLPNHSAFKVAETFRTLLAIAPGPRRPRARPRTRHRPADGARAAPGHEDRPRRRLPRSGRRAAGVPRRRLRRGTPVRAAGRGAGRRRPSRGVHARVERLRAAVRRRQRDARRVRAPHEPGDRGRRAAPLPGGLHARCGAAAVVGDLGARVRQRRPRRGHPVRGRLGADDAQPAPRTSASRSARRRSRSSRASAGVPQRRRATRTGWRSGPPDDVVERLRELQAARPRRTRSSSSHPGSTGRAGSPASRPSPPPGPDRSGSAACSCAAAVSCAASRERRLAQLPAARRCGTAPRSPAGAARTTPPRPCCPPAGCRPSSVGSSRPRLRGSQCSTVRRGVDDDLDRVLPARAHLLLDGARAGRGRPAG